jgi:ankyrin repeat protein
MSTTGVGPGRGKDRRGRALSASGEPAARLTCMRCQRVLPAVMRALLTLLVLAFAATPAAAGDLLFDAVAAGDKPAVEQALANGGDVDSRAPDQATPLITAALGDQLAIVEFLLSKDADVMARNSGGFTPLHAAAFAGSLPIAKLLLAKGAVLEDSANKAGATPMMVAGEENHVELAEFLIAQGADVNHAEGHGYMPITRAFWKGNKDIIRLYRRHGATCQGANILGSEAAVAECAEIHD